jgi:hypothetical protein
MPKWGSLETVALARFRPDELHLPAFSGTSLDMRFFCEHAQVSPDVQMFIVSSTMRIL